MNVTVTGIGDEEGGITTFWESTMFVAFNDTMVNVDVPPGNRAVDSWSRVSLAWKLQVKGPAVEGEQITVASSIVPVRLVLNVITLSTKQESAGLEDMSVPEALAL